MRGKVCTVGNIIMIDRITPAYAGKSVRSGIDVASEKDHPRLCGEKAGLPRRSPPVSGSPPPMRGKVKMSAYFSSAIGITPAYAGKSNEADVVAKSVQDHPRLCGEKWWRKMYVYRVSGSPPPMRGKDFRLVFNDAVKGITPAYAGKRAEGKDHLLLLEDHPRLCGEKSKLNCSILGFSGSPPPMRGKESACWRR